MRGTEAATATRRALAVAVCLALASGGAAAWADDGDLDQARGELEVAGRELTDIEAQVQRAGDALAASDQRLRDTSTELLGVRDELAAADAAAARTGATERDAAEQLQDTTDTLAALSTAHRDGRDQLASQAVTAYKRGGNPTADLVFTGVVRADDWHEVAITRGVLERVLTDQRDAVDTDAQRTRDTANANAEVADARRHAVTAARQAASERERVTVLVTTQERLVATVERETAARAETLAGLESDSGARAVLVRELEQRVTALELAAVTVRVPVAVPAVDGPPPAWATGLPPAGRPWAATIDAAAQAQGIDGRLLAALVWTESAFRADAVSHAGAIGLAQLMPGTARGLGVDPHDPAANLAGGARYLASQLDAFGHVDLALAAYNAGPGRVRQAGGAVPDIVETQLYVVRVLERYEALRER